MGGDPYEALGLKKGAGDDDIRKAWRRFVRESHPDIHPDDPKAAERFKAASAAYDLLKDPEKRRRFDAGEIDASGAERPDRTYWRQYSGRPDYAFRGRGAGAPGGGADFGGIFDDLFGRGPGAGMGGGMGGGPGFSARGTDLPFTLEVDFLDAALGAVREIALPSGERLKVRIPEGTADGQTIRLRGKGGVGFGAGGRGDALVTVTVRPHPLYRREGDDIHLTLPITIDEAVLGAKVEVPTLGGRVNVTVPRGAASGQVLRLRGRGVKGGDQLVELRIVPPPAGDAALEAFLEDWRRTHGYDPRKGMAG